MAKDPTQRQKLKRLWLNRGLLSLGFLCLLGVAAIRVPVALEQQSRYRQTQAQLQSFNLERSQEQSLMQELVQELARLRQLELEWSRSLEQSLEWSLNLSQERLMERSLELERVLTLERRMTYEFIGLGATALGGLVLLLLLMSQRDRTGVPLTGHLVLVLPEECVAELAALHQRLRKQRCPRWYVRFRMVQETLELMFGVYVQINLDNWGLPGQGNRIDDE